AMSIDVTLFRLDVEQQRIDLYVKHTAAGSGNLIVETLDFLAHSGFEVSGRECLAVHYDERYWCCGRTCWLRALCWLRLCCGLRLGCVHRWFARCAATFGRLC